MLLALTIALAIDSVQEWQMNVQVYATVTNQTGRSYDYIHFPCFALKDGAAVASGAIRVFNLGPRQTVKADGLIPFAVDLGYTSVQCRSTPVIY